MRVALSLSFLISFPVLVVYGAYDDSSHTHHTDCKLTSLLNQLGTLRGELESSLSKLIEEAFTEARKSSTFSMADFELRFKELDLLVDSFDNKCENDIAVFNVKNKGTDLSSESDVVENIYFSFKEAKALLKAESDMLMKELEAKVEELSTFVNAKIQRCREEAFTLLVRCRKSGSINQLTSTYRKSTERLLEMISPYQHKNSNLQEIMQSIDRRNIIQRKFAQAFSKTWISETNSLYEVLVNSVNKRQQLVAELERERERVVDEQKNELAGFNQMKAKCLKSYAADTERHSLEREKLLRENVKLTRKYYMELLRVEVLLVKAEARVGIEEAKKSLLMDNFFSLLLKCEEKQCFKTTVNMQ